MDILEQHLDQQDVSSVNPKVEVGTALVLEETDMVECEAYDPLAGDNQAGDDGIRYPETVSYRVVQVNSNSVTNDIDLPVTHQSGNSVQVLTAPGQYFIVSNPNEIFTTTPSSRSLAPRATTLQIDSPRSMTPSVKKRDDRRRATHNEVERRRRDKINNWIAKLK
ncbi:hypothetical protein HCN44_002129 [Aphidius gifuensis]|uniref:BHLH domain-containing protein n=2 Tax=Aphidius gifuensis TaxID=684658 RepID=A0A835CUJ2_APHGI|nr:hypothetical protein HCN44_002129 [Aphidius gifuensis]